MHAATADETDVEPRQQQRGCRDGHAGAGKPESSDEGIRVASPDAIRIPSRAHTTTNLAAADSLGQRTFSIGNPGCARGSVKPGIEVNRHLVLQRSRHRRSRRETRCSREDDGGEVRAAIERMAARTVGPHHSSGSRRRKLRAAMASMESMATAWDSVPPDTTSTREGRSTWWKTRSG